LSATRIANNIARYKAELLKTWEDLPLLILTSAETRKGRDEILTAIEEMRSASAGA